MDFNRDCVLRQGGCDVRSQKSRLLRLTCLLSMSFLDAREHGCRPGSVLKSSGCQGMERKKQISKIAEDVHLLSGYPFLMRNYQGRCECLLCRTLHITEGSYLSHVAGRRHRRNEALRLNLCRNKKLCTYSEDTISTKLQAVGLPGYRVSKQYDVNSRQRSILFCIEFQRALSGNVPVFRVASALERRDIP